MVGFAAFSMTVSSAVFADDIYKWTDENGDVYYADRPSGEPSEEILQFSYNRTNSTAVQKRVQAHRDTTAARRVARAEAGKAALTAIETRELAEQKLAQCHEYRAKLQTMANSRRLYRQSDAGERVYLDEAAKAEAHRNIEALIKDTCGD